MYVTLRFLYCSLCPQFDDEIKCVPLIFIVWNISDSLFCYCSCWSFWWEFFRKFNVLSSWVLMVVIQQLNGTAQKMNFSITDFFSKCDQIRSFLPLSPILLVFFYHEHIADIDFHCFFFMTKVMALCPLLKAVKYSWTHLFHLSSSGESAANLISLQRILKFGVNTEHFKSSSIYVKGRLFSLTSTSNNTSSNSDHVNNDFPMDLYRLCFVSPIKRSYCPTHHCPLERLNFQIILSLLKKSWNLHLH